MAGIGYFDPGEPGFAALEEAVARRTTAADAPSAAAIEAAIPIYDAPSLATRLAAPADRRALMAEWGAVLGEGAGVLVVKRAVTDLEALAAATEAFHAIIAEERAASGGGGDHFAAAGANDRIWNSAQKLCLRAPEVHARLFGSPALDAVCEAWLGPAYQMTAQVNLVRPGGAAQEAHRDYHLGFQTADEAARWPAPVHILSARLTLQGAIAQTDMPAASGPTKLLPFSQTWPEGYVAFRHPTVRALFEARHVQLPLSRGDALFFNPALLHAAGENTTQDVARMANLLQVSSAFGRAMESLDRRAMAEALYPALLSLKESGALSPAALDAAIAATAEGYPFPTSLDSDPPMGGLAPETQAGLLRRALAEGWTAAAVAEALAAQEARRRP